MYIYYLELLIWFFHPITYIIFPYCHCTLYSTVDLEEYVFLCLFFSIVCCILNKLIPVIDN